MYELQFVNKLKIVQMNSDPFLCANYHIYLVHKLSTFYQNLITIVWAHFEIFSCLKAEFIFYGLLPNKHILLDGGYYMIRENFAQLMVHKYADYWQNHDLPL